MNVAAPRRSSETARAGIRPLVGALVVSAVAALVAIAVSATWDSTAEGETYRVSTRVLPPSRVEIPTSIGTATFDTHALGPGGQVNVSAMALPPVQRTGSAPFIDLSAQLDEIKDLTRAAALGSLWRFGAGALAGGVLGALSWQGLAGSHGRSWRRRVLLAAGGGMGAGALVVGAAAAAVLVSFDEDYGSSLQADGLLAVGLSAEELLQELDSRDQAYAGYVQSLATYVKELQEDAGIPGATDITARALLVSDIHGRNVYPQLRAVVESQDVDFVVDSGDLVQWGTGFELTAREGLTQGVRSLDVPYLFVKGNHDGPATVRALARVPNVTVLDGQATEVAGLTVLGVADPRLYQDGGPVEAEQAAEVEELERAAAADAVRRLEESGGLPRPPDLVVMHHPSGAAELGGLTDAPVRVAGHTHEADLRIEDDHSFVNVGTTGAAGLRTFNRQDEQGRVEPTPQSFDVLNFNARCELVSLTRFAYPDVLSEVGRARVTYETLLRDAGQEDTSRLCP